MMRMKRKEEYKVYQKNPWRSKTLLSFLIHMKVQKMVRLIMGLVLSASSKNKDYEPQKYSNYLKKILDPKISTTVDS
jgi:hypothetical protein